MRKKLEGKEKEKEKEKKWWGERRETGRRKEERGRRKGMVE